MNGRQPQAERKLVTILFADLAGFSSLAETLDPEPLRELLNSLFNRLVPCVEQNGGTVDKFMGDCLMALFGAPASHDDDASRAIRAALDILGAVDAFNAQHDHTLAVHVGINTGRVVTGLVGGGGCEHYSVLGDEVNIARRLQEVAAPGEILVGARTASLAGPHFFTQEAGKVQLRGRSEPVCSYRVLGSRPSSAYAADCEATTRLAPLVGREPELEVVTRLLDRLRSGEGGILLLTGEAGLGKSRLLAEARRQFGRDNLRWLQGRALSFGHGLAYHPIKEIIEQDVGIRPGDDQDIRYGKILARARNLGIDDGETVMTLATLVGLELPPGLREELRYTREEELRRRLLESVRRHLAAISCEGPLALVLEDLDWTDGSSKTLLRQLLPVAAESPILFCLVSRAQDPLQLAHSPGDRDPRCPRTRLHLKPLGPRPTKALLQSLLQLEELPLNLEKTVLSRTGGNPLFLEQLVRHLTRSEAPGVLPDRVVDLASQAQNGQVPETLEGVICARIDCLTEDARELLRHASVIGPAFSYRILSAFIGTRFSNLSEALLELTKLGFLNESVEQGTPVLSFRHALIQEAAYESILISERKVLHLRLAQAVEEVYPDRTEELCALLAYHYTRAESWEGAHSYLMAAGARAVIMAADVEALWHYQQALGTILSSSRATQEISEDGAPGQWLISHTDPFWHAGQLGTLVEPVKIFYHRALDSFGQYDSRTIAAACVLAAAHLQRDEGASASALLDPLLALTKTDGDAQTPLTTRVTMLLGIARMQECRFQEAEDLLQQALAGELSLGGRADLLASIYTYLGTVCFFLGSPARCRRVCEMAVESPDVQKSNFFWLILLNLSSAHLDAGEADRAVAAAQRCLDGPANPFARAFAHSHLGAALQALGRFDEAERGFESAQTQFERLGLYGEVSAVLAELAEMHLRAGRIELAEANAVKALRRADQRRHWWKPTAYLTLAGVALARGDLKTAEEMLELLGSSNMSAIPAVSSYRAEMQHRWAELRYQQGRVQEAAEQLERSISIWRQLGGDSHPRLRSLRAAWEERGLWQSIRTSTSPAPTRPAST
jgi:class 3 adenylate cyclase/tetratricopeptide (TPR) repeat protein